ncbi:predicted protein [Uncinocarpus reesii 1704]|uniref:Uncharacterized protein n=1 Tax=Uncinocarpus reesii (strain UAMH 1704) TaxID=336963 RepID=C4JDE4_UNCRE|nr:uncharacterized protein UREG_00318 [Uncinocarpus reesii 1704]EEP75472.1 predicted protein [Uncinocarpus reesii 1704]
MSRRSFQVRPIGQSSWWIESIAASVPLEKQKFAGIANRTFFCHGGEARHRPAHRFMYASVSFNTAQSAFLLNSRRPGASEGFGHILWYGATKPVAASGGAKRRARTLTATQLQRMNIDARRNKAAVVEERRRRRRWKS